MRRVKKCGTIENYSNMPYLNKPKQKVKYKKKNTEENDKIYHSKRWKILRNNFIQKHPLCEICYASGKIVSAQDVHHKDGFNNYSGNARIEKAFDESNLMSLCKKHHAELHKNHTVTKGFDLNKYKKEHPDEFSNKKNGIIEDF